MHFREVYSCLLHHPGYFEIPEGVAKQVGVLRPPLGTGSFCYESSGSLLEFLSGYLMEVTHFDKWVRLLLLWKKLLIQ
jgi:hypothetical protein